MAWVLVPSLVSLRNEFNALAPGRDKTSDGSVGDTSHAAGASDHNPDETGNPETYDADNVDEVHAIDVDIDLRLPGWSMERCVQLLLARCRSGAETRLKYIIYNRRIWTASNSWQQEYYDGSNPHDHHAHFSASYTSSAEASTRPWGLLAQEDIVLDADIKKIAKQVVAEQVAALKDAKSDYFSQNRAIAWKYPLSTEMSALGAIVAIHGYAKSTNDLVKLLAQDSDVDEGQIAKAVLAGLDVKAIASAVVAALPPDQAEQVVNELSIRLRTAG